jgi:acyl carrier protein phosphodiesterase
MNYLAHLFLAGDEINLLVGNFIADHVKGSRIDSFNPVIQSGIRMHRAIDRYTDSHPVVSESILRLRPVYRKYAGVIVDIYYDHFLASHWNHFSKESLSSFTNRTYSMLASQKDILPTRSQRILSYMTTHDWLQSYAHLGGLHQAFKGMASRTTFESGMENASFTLEKNYELFQKEFNSFFPMLIEFVYSEFPTIIRNK